MGLISKAATVSAVAWALCAGAAAQAPSNALSTDATPSGLMEAFSAGDVAAMVADFEVATQLEDYVGDETATLIATTPGGAGFFITLFDCADPTTGQACEQAFIYTGLSNAGLAYEDLNNFNSMADVTKAVNVSDQRMVLFGTQIFAGGGIGPGNFKLLTALFLNDMQNYVDSRSTVVNVAEDVETEARGKVDNRLGADARRAPIPSAAQRASLENALSSAIANTWRVDFLTDNAAEFLD